jgi:hypothetical protein
MVGAWSIALVVLAGITVNWLNFRSSIYPYRISQPSSYQHQVIEDVSHEKRDYFFPGLGSFVTNVNIFADHSKLSAPAYLRSIGGRHVRKIGMIRIMGKWRTIYAADFTLSYSGPYTLEQVCFSASHRLWRLTMSYDWKFRKKQRPLMLKMLKSFHTN